MAMAKFRKKPVVVEAIRWTGGNLLAVVAFMESSAPDLKHPMAAEAWDAYSERVDAGGLVIKTLEGQHIASIGDWIIKGIQGEHYPCKPDIFESTYEPVSAE